MFKVNIAKWIAREINGTELALLRAEDSLLEAQMRVKAMRQRLDRLKTRQELDEERRKRAQDTDSQARPARLWSYIGPMQESVES